MEEKVYETNDEIIEYIAMIYCDGTLGYDENTQLVKNKRHTHKHWKDGADTPAMTLMEDTRFNLSILKKEFVSDDDLI